MIEIKDLSVGNYVYYSSRTKFPMYVEFIGDNYCYLNFKENQGDAFEVKEKDMMPIEVTELLLMKIGFKPVPPVFEGQEEYQMIVNDCFVEVKNGVSNSIDRDWYCHIDNTAHSTIGGFDFQYLHELQNGIRLITKSDLEIKEL